MVFEFKLPDLGEGIHEGEIKKWLVKEGDVVKEHQPIAEVETDKAVVDLPSPKAGKILKINFKEGDTVKVGDVVIVIGESGEKVSAKTAKAPAKAEAKTSKKPKRIAKGATGAVGELEEAPDDDEEPVKVAKPIVSKVSTVEALPAVRKLAQTLKVDLTTVHGTGASGRHSRGLLGPCLRTWRGPHILVEPLRNRYYYLLGCRHWGLNGGHADRIGKPISEDRFYRDSEMGRSRP